MIIGSFTGHLCHDQRENGNDRRRDTNITVSADKISSQHVRTITKSTSSDILDVLSKKVE